MFLNVKDKYQIGLENKITEQNNKIKNLEEILQFFQEISLSQQRKIVIKEKLLNCLQIIKEVNKLKTFEKLKKQLIRKFKKNKKVLAEQLFTKTYLQKIKQWNKNWNEKVEFSENLAVEHITEIKEIFAKTEKK